ncbi:unnamed protein product [Paramecium octaurelia]|uniref:Uncharacterized protein n=1 Tax=Paramecium octaurelia TaxID=43137 RepID=A0A8S1WV39_PAROT|nr:unnamed protein product [Paramecium octaurelia]
MKQNITNNPKVIRKRPWSEDEDMKVLELIQTFGPQKWTQIAQYLQGRVGKQCRERFMPLLIFLDGIIIQIHRQKDLLGLKMKNGFYIYTTKSFVTIYTFNIYRQQMV